MADSGNKLRFFLGGLLSALRTRPAPVDQAGQESSRQQTADGHQELVDKTGNDERPALQSSVQGTADHSPDIFRGYVPHDALGIDRVNGGRRGWQTGWAEHRHGSITVAQLLP